MKDDSRTAAVWSVDNLPLQSHICSIPGSTKLDMVPKDDLAASGGKDDMTDQFQGEGEAACEMVIKHHVMCAL